MRIHPGCSPCPGDNCHQDNVGKPSSRPHSKIVQGRDHHVAEKASLPTEIRHQLREQGGLLVSPRPVRNMCWKSKSGTHTHSQFNATESSGAASVLPLRSACCGTREPGLNT